MQGCGRKAIWRENLGGDGVEALETQIGWHRVWVSSAGASPSPPLLLSNPEVWQVQIRKLDIIPWAPHMATGKGGKTQPERSTALLRHTGTVL